LFLLKQTTHEVCNIASGVCIAPFLHV